MKTNMRGSGLLTFAVMFVLMSLSNADNGDGLTEGDEQVVEGMSYYHHRQDNDEARESSSSSSSSLSSSYVDLLRSDDGTPLTDEDVEAAIMSKAHQWVMKDLDRFRDVHGATHKLHAVSPSSLVYEKEQTTHETSIIEDLYQQMSGYLRGGGWKSNV